MLDRWRDIVNAMLEKIQGLPRITKLRVIHLFEADMNFYLGIIWGRSMVHSVESVKGFGNENWGSGDLAQERGQLTLYC